MIDLHSHILPGVDDGPKSLDESLGLAEAYANAGFKQIVATPHWISGTAWTPTPQDIQQKVSVFKQALKDHQLDITISQGMEIAFDIDIDSLFEQKKILSLAGGPYVLIESPFQRFPMGWEQIFFRIISKGFIIILAHPERCDQLIGDPSFTENIIGTGVYIQVNCDSFLGGYGKYIQKTAVTLAEKGHIHCLATDSHDAVHRRPANFSESLAIVEKLIGKKNTHKIAFENPKRVLSGADLVVPEPIKRAGSRKKRGKSW